MLEYIKSNYGNRPSANEGEKLELEFLRKETQKLKEEIAKAGGGGGKSTASDREYGSSSNSEGEE